MKVMKYAIIGLVLVLSSCSSIKVTTDYDSGVVFGKYKTFAFFKTGIDKADISDLDKKRILRAIERELKAQGFTKSDNPDFLVSIFAKSRERVDVNQSNLGLGWGWGWGPGWGGNQVSTSTEGMLYIDIIDNAKKELIWQGSGTGYLATKNIEKKEARIKEFVQKTLMQFPPEK